MKKYKFIVNSAKSVLFILTLVVGLLISMLIPLRPSYSDNEKRKLTEFPKLSGESLLNGSFFSGVDTWFADTFPFRESMITAYSKIENMYGIHTAKVHGNVEKGDTIPDSPSKSASKPSSASSTSSLKGESGSSAQASSEAEEQAQQGQTFGGVLLIGNSAYEYYNFNTAVANRYAGAVSTATARLKGISTVYDIIAPTSIGITLSDATKKSINSSDQKKAIDYMYGSMSQGTKTVSIYDKLINHRKEYIYFRTDHHWTQLGAWYAYEEYAKAAGIEPIKIKQYSTVSYDGFLGSFYAATKKDAALAAKPDTVTAFKLINNASMQITAKNGNTYSWPVLSDPTKAAENLKYAATFIGGDQPLVTITNNDLSDGPTCVLIKESFGNAFAPLLIPHYKNIYVVDYRYYKGSLVELAQTTGAKDVIFLNNISATRTVARMSELESLVNR